MTVDLEKYFNQHLESIQKHDEVLRLLEMLTANDPYFNLKNAAKYSDYSVSSLRRYIANGEITYHQRASHIVIRKSDLDNWIAKSKIKGKY